MCAYDLPDEVIERDPAGRATVFCDPCLAPMVKALNAGGVRTLASCCGHGKMRPIITIATAEGDRHLVIYEDLDRAMAAVDG